MKFKARLLDGGLHALHAHFLPALSKVDKECVVYLTPTKMVLTQNYFKMDAVRVTASLGARVVFAEYKVKSLERDRIAFPADVTLLQRALQSIKRIFNYEVGDVYVKLTRKAPPGHDRGGDGGGAGQQGPQGQNQPGGARGPVPRASGGIPYLSFVARRPPDDRTGQPGRVLITQDVPVGEPLPPVDLTTLDDGAKTARVRTYLALPRHFARVAAMVDRLRALSPCVALGVSRDGRLFVRGAGGELGASVGAEFTQLSVLGVREPYDDDLDGDGTQSRTEGPAARMRRLAVEGKLDRAVVDQKHLAQALCCQLTAPARTIVGVAGQSQYMVVGCQYDDETVAYGERQDALGGATFAPDVHLEFKLPIRMDETDDLV